jgi:hypothetical protein
MISRMESIFTDVITTFVYGARQRQKPTEMSLRLEFLLAYVSRRRRNSVMYSQTLSTINLFC